RLLFDCRGKDLRGALVGVAIPMGVSREVPLAIRLLAARLVELSFEAEESNARGAQTLPQRLEQLRLLAAVAGVHGQEVCTHAAGRVVERRGDRAGNGDRIVPGVVGDFGLEEIEERLEWRPPGRSGPQPVPEAGMGGEPQLRL